MGNANSAYGNALKRDGGYPRSQWVQDCLSHHNADADYMGVAKAAETDVVGANDGWNLFHHTARFQQVKMCMLAVDCDRLEYVRERLDQAEPGLDLRIESLMPLNCTPKNNV